MTHPYTSSLGNASAEFMSAFHVPAVARPVIGHIVADTEMLLVVGLAGREFSPNDARDALIRLTGEPWSTADVDTLLRAAYRRGVIDLADESFERFRVGSFYGRLGVFVISEPDAYRTFSSETRAALDRWFIHAYIEGLDAGESTMGDTVLGLDKILAHLDTVTEQIWLNPCDCRILAGGCDLPVNVCVSFANGINTPSHRGWSKPLTREEAKAVVSTADADGLMHTLTAHGICNCCSDCCYLFRAQALRGSGPAVWPRAEQIARFHRDACTECGRCIDRCPFDAFSEAGAGIVFDEARCRGCGLCAETCPTHAIELCERLGDV